LNDPKIQKTFKDYRSARRHLAAQARPPARPSDPRKIHYRPDRYQPVRHPSRSGCSGLRCGCLLAILVICITIAGAAAAILPGRTNILLLGVDYVDPGSYVSRTDTIILTSFTLQRPLVRLLSVPRDLWVTIPGVGENRINTAHFFAETSQPGTGPQAVIRTVEANFSVSMDYYLRLRFEGFEIVDAMEDGVDIVLDRPMAGYEAGRHHLTGHKALAFVRSRVDSDDFSRMQQGQLMLKSIFLNLLKPTKYPRLPLVAAAFFKSVDTNVPVWMWPRLAVMLLAAGPDGIELQTIQREMVKPYTTNQGASVLLPNWELILPLIHHMFQS